MDDMKYKFYQPDEEDPHLVKVSTYKVNAETGRRKYLAEFFISSDMPHTRGERWAVRPNEQVAHFDFEATDSAADADVATTARETAARAIYNLGFTRLVATAKDTYSKQIMEAAGFTLIPGVAQGPTTYRMQRRR